MADSILKRRLDWPVATIAAWLVPGLGHFLIGRKLRALIIFITIHAMFLTGMAIGGVFTINPRVEKWWQYAQLGAGSAAVACNIRQEKLYKSYLAKGGNADRADQLIAEDGLALVEPAKSNAIIYSAIAGLMNIICAADVCLLCMMGSFGEPEKGKMPPEAIS